MESELEIGPVSDFPPGTVKGVGSWVVGNAGGKYFALSRRCRHLFADLGKGAVDKDDELVCPWHASKYDVESGRMTRGPQGFFAKVPGLGPTYKAITTVFPLRRATVVERDGKLFVRS